MSTNTISIPHHNPYSSLGGEENLNSIDLANLWTPAYEINSNSDPSEGTLNHKASNEVGPKIRPQFASYNLDDDEEDELRYGRIIFAKLFKQLFRPSEWWKNLPEEERQKNRDDKDNIQKELNACPEGAEGFIFEGMLLNELLIELIKEHKLQQVKHISKCRVADGNEAWLDAAIKYFEHEHKTVIVRGDKDEELLKQQFLEYFSGIRVNEETEGKVKALQHARGM